MQRATLAALVLGVLGLALLVALTVRVATLEASELDRWSDGTRVEALQAAGGRAPLDTVFLEAGDRFQIEVCADREMAGDAWRGAIRLHLVSLASGEALLTQELDDAALARVRTGSGSSCLTIAAGDLDAADQGEMRIDAELVSPGQIAGAELRSHALARREVTGTDRNLVLALLLVSLGAIVALALRSPSGAEPVVGSGAARIGGALLIVVGAFYLLGLIGRGPTLGLFGGLALAAIEVGVAFALIRAAAGERGSALALERPRTRARALAGMGVAPFAGIALFFAAIWAQGLFPVDTEAPIALYVRFPSGMLSFAALAVVAPIAEEVFFRGLVYGVIRGPGGVKREVAAASGAWLLFALAHLPQDWGNWAGLAAVLVAGLGFTVLRAASGSTLVPCIAHLVYNGLHVTLLLAPR